MKKVIIAVLVTVLALSLIGPATAKKKKRKKAEPTPIELQYFMRRADCGTDADNPHLSLTDAEDVDCAFATQMAADTGAFDMRIPYVAADGLPLTLDVSRTAAGTITIRNWNGAGAGNVVLDLELIGTIAGEEKVLGTYSESFIALPTQSHTTEYEIELDQSLAGALVEGLTLAVFTHGQTVGIAGMVEHDEPPSVITIPALQT